MIQTNNQFKVIYFSFAIAVNQKYAVVRSYSSSSKWEFVKLS